MSDFLLAQLEQLQAKDAKRRLNMKPVLWTQLQQAEPDSHIVSFGNSFYLSHLLERTSLRACLQSLRESGVSVDSVKSLLVFALTASLVVIVVIARCRPYRQYHQYRLYRACRLCR